MVAATNPATPKSITTKHLAYELAEQHQLAESGLRAYKALSLGGSLCPKGVPLPSVRLIRFAKLTVLIADVSTIFCAFLIVGWQIIIFLRAGNWWALPLSLVFNMSEHNQGEIYSTASIDKIVARHSTNFTDALLQLPIIMILLFGAAALTAFYLWISRVEKELTKTQIQIQ